MSFGPAFRTFLETHDPAPSDTTSKLFDWLMSMQDTQLKGLCSQVGRCRQGESSAAEDDDVRFIIWLHNARVTQIDLNTRPEMWQGAYMDVQLEMRSAVLERSKLDPSFKDFLNF